MIKALHGSVPKEYSERAVQIADYLIRPNQVWLRTTIEARDKLNHFLEGGISWKYFGVCRTVEGRVVTPRWSPEQSVTEFLDTVWNNLFRFCEDFVAFFLAMRLPRGLALERVSSDMASSEPVYTVTLDERSSASLQKLIDSETE